MLQIQSLRDAWATLRRLHTSTAVAFESQLRPEFLGRHDKIITTNDTSHCLNNDNDNDVVELLQLPPNATIPDATALAVFYDQIYNGNDNGNCGSSFNNNTNAIIANDYNSKEDKNHRPSALFTSPLLLSPLPWTSANSGISGGFGASVANDYGLCALHELCTQYSEWIQQSFVNCKSMETSEKLPMMQLDRFRSNFETLLRQYDDSDDNDITDNNDTNEDDEYDNIRADSRKGKILVHNEDSINKDKSDLFMYEQLYEDNVEGYVSGSGDYDDDEDDDNTVICCSINNPGMSVNTNAMVATVEDKERGELMLRTIRGDRRRSTGIKKYREEDRYFRWINNALINGRCLPAPLNTVFRTELHVRLFWPPTLLLRNVNHNGDQQTFVPAYALGTTYAAITALKRERQTRNNCRRIRSLSGLNRVITAQLDRVSRDMRHRYAAMDNFLDRACDYSISATRKTQDEAVVNTTTDTKQRHHMCLQSH